MRLLKSRKMKIKLMHAVNYFRAVQRILAFELKNYVTRERSLGDKQDVIQPQFGKDENGIPLANLAGASGPGRIFKNNIARELDIKQNKPDQDDPVTLKSYKYCNLFNQEVSSTCPIVPKHHRTFGRPNMYQTVSQEIDQRNNLLNQRVIRDSLTIKRDRIIVDRVSCEIKVLNEYGHQIFYDEALNDMLQIEEEILKIGSYYINHHEYLLASNDIAGPRSDTIDESSISSAQLKDRPSSLIDRAQIANDLYIKEFDFQFAKVLLIEELLEVFEHTTDPLDSVRHIQCIVDVMALRPRLNLESTIYSESYDCEIQNLEQKRLFFSEFIELQKEIEQDANQQIKNFQELKKRRVNELIAGEFQFNNQKEADERVGSDEKGMEKSQTLEVQERIRLKMLREQQHQIGIKNIKAKHITEFANEQLTDFAAVLGLPEISMQDLAKKKDQMEPVVIDSIREKAFFSKQIEGYPAYFSDVKELGQKLGLHTEKIGLFDFYESLGIFPKVNAALHQSLEELINVNKPENGMATSALELELYSEARLVLRKIRQTYENAHVGQCRGQALIEEDFFFANSDKLIFEMKEFKAGVAPENLYKYGNPLVLSKLDEESVKNYNLPQIKLQEVVDDLNRWKAQSQIDNSLIVARMIDMAKKSVARPLNDVNADFYDESDSEQEPKEVKAPSMMRMCCNAMEALRLREELIQRLYETHLLGEIFKAQCKIQGKSNKFDFTDQIHFQVHSYFKEFANIVDNNDGIKLQDQLGLAFMEFDASLSAILDFKSESCIKTLFLDLGVQELRAILHYQVMQQHLLTIGVKTNQYLIDGPQQGLTELELIKKEISVPNAVINVEKLQRDINEGRPDSQKYETTRMKALMSRLSDCQYMAFSKKNRYREKIQKQYNIAFNQLMQQRGDGEKVEKPEHIARILRSFRLKVLHLYCNNVRRDIYVDSLKVQSLQIANELRRKALLFPQDENRLFEIKLSDEDIENLSFNERLQVAAGLENTEPMDIVNILQASLSHHTLFYVPSTEELIQMDRMHVDDETKLKDAFFKDLVLDCETLEDEIKALVKIPTRFDNGQARYKTNKKMRFNVRKVNFKEAHDYDTQAYSVLVYLNQMLSIFNLTFTMMKNSTRTSDLYELEKHVISGREFWGKVQELKKQQQKVEHEYFAKGTDLEEILEEKAKKGDCSKRAIERILQRKKRWLDLQEDLLTIKQKFKEVDKWMLRLPADRRNLPYICDMLVLQHQQTYYHFLNGIESILKFYCENQNDEYFGKIAEIRAAAVKQQSGFFFVLKNGYYVTQAGTAPNHICLEASDHDEFLQFHQAYSPIVDENELIPREVRMLRRLYGNMSKLERFSKDSIARASIANYAELRSAFMNIDETNRCEVLFSTFNQGDEEIKNYLKFRGLLDPNDALEEKWKKMAEKGKIVSEKEMMKQRLPFKKGKDFDAEVLQAKVEFLCFKIEKGQVQRVMMSWLNGGSNIPKTTREYRSLLRQFKDRVMMNCLQETQKLNEIYWGIYQQGAKLQKSEEDIAAEQSDKQTERRRILDPLEMSKVPLYAFFNSVNQMRAETNVSKMMLEQYLIRIAIQTIRAEVAALEGAFEETGSEIQIQAFVHPQQQFASTMYQDIDKNQHLDIVSKLGFVQQFLSRLRNRSQEVQTLTSGPGIVFTMKDFNECVLVFCKAVIKYGEQELRQRSETAAIMKHQYHHLIYLKEMEALYFRTKCEQFLMNIDTIISTKLSHKGNQMIHEMDVTSRELRNLKDHYYLMEKFTKQEVHSLFKREISAYQNQIKELKENFMHYQDRMKSNYLHQVTENIEKLQKQKEDRSFLVDLSRIRDDYDQEEDQVIKPKQAVETLEGKSKAYRQIELLIDKNHKQKFLYMMQAFVAEARHKKELELAQEKLTKNDSLWQQLAESQKREQLSQKELEMNKQTLADQESQIKKLHVQLAHLTQQKNQLQNYKESKAKRMGELEDKMKDLEILENIDLQKILIEMQRRDEKIQKLGKVESEFQDQVETMRKAFTVQMQLLRSKFQKEREAKADAFEKLESMRLEMKALEGKDMKNDLWKDKCKELYEICKELENENDKLRNNFGAMQQEFTETKVQLTNQIQILNEQNAKMQAIRQSIQVQPPNDESNQLRENVILQRHNYIKPMTANAGKNKRVFSGTNDSNHGHTQTMNSTTNMSGRAIGIGKKVRNQGLAMSHDKFGKHKNLAAGLAFSADQLQQNHFGTGQIQANDVANTITSNTSFPGISENLERLKHQQRVNGQFKGFALSNRAGNQALNQTMNSNAPIGAVRGNQIAPGTQSGKMVAMQGSAVLSGNVLQFNQTQATSFGSSTHTGQKPSRVQTSQGNRGRQAHLRVEDSLAESGKETLLQ